MAAVAPTVFFENYSYDGNNLVIPLASLSGLTASEAHPVTGDGREILRILLETAYQQYAALSTKPTKMTATKPSPSGQSENVVRLQYTFSFDLTINPASLVIASD